MIADDRPIVRSGLKVMLSTADQISVVAAGNVAKTLAMSVAHRPNVVLLDFDVPGGRGVAATRQLLSRFPRTRIIGVTLTDGEAALDALEAGAVGCVFRDDDSDDLLRIIRAALRGDTSLRPQAVRLLMKARAATPPTERLTPREREILALLATGLTNKEIAQRLKLREKTVKSYMTSIFRRLGVDSRIQAALWAERHGISK